MGTLSLWAHTPLGAHMRGESGPWPALRPGTSPHLSAHRTLCSFEDRPGLRGSSALLSLDSSI